MLKYFYQNIVKLTLSNELDVVLAYKRARQLAEMTGITIPTQTKFATAVSEICRNVIEHVGEGNIQFHVVEETGRLFVEACIVDYGRGIANVEQVLQRKNVFGKKGWGIPNSKKLVDRFHIRSNQDQGTCVQLLMKIPVKHPPINKTIIEGWQDFFRNEVVVSPYEEIKLQNIQVLEVMEALRVKSIETENQLDEIKKLNEELERSNHNITQLLEEREDSNRLLQKMNKELEQFAYTVSHDLKAPLKNITGLVNLLRKSIDLSANDKGRRQFTMLEEQVQRMEKLINDILTYSRSGRQNTQIERVDVKRLLEQVIGSITVPPHFDIQIRTEMPVMEAEEIYLHQIFSNLIGNAVKYHDQEKGHIDISFSRNNGTYTFSVADDGPGIPVDKQEKIFDMFYTTDTSASQESTGLGLSIVKKIISEKGGDVWVESQGRGATFCFTWPQ